MINYHISFQKILERFLASFFCWSLTENKTENLFRIEYVSTTDRKVRQFKDITISVTKPVITQKPTKAREEPIIDDHQRDTNGSYYLFIGKLRFFISYQKLTRQRDKPFNT